MRVYLDNAATTRPCEPAVTAAFHCMVENIGNPSSLHKLGIEAEKALTLARTDIAAAMICAPECLYFTSGATESNNLAIRSAAEIYGRRKKKIVTTTLEHPSVAEPINWLEDQGYEVVRVAPDRSGEIDDQDVIGAVDDDTCLVSCMMVNNETGYMLPVKKIFMAVKRNFPECVTHCDAVQAFLKVPLKTTELYADCISISAHKVHGIKGCGALFVKKGIRISPLHRGGGQERGVRSGTESVPLAAGFGAAVKALQVNLQASMANAEDLNRYLREKLSGLEGVVIHSREENHSPFIVNASVMGIRSEILLHFLEDHDIFVSSGSACSKGAVSGVLRQFGVSDAEADCALRISLSRETTSGDIDQLVRWIQKGQDRFLRGKAQ